jgi:hypothetical protein
VNTSTPIDYGGYKKGGRVSRAAIAAAALGWSCGPVALGIIWVELYIFRQDFGLAFATLMGCPAIAFLWSVVAYIRLKKTENNQSRMLAILGVIGSIVWAVITVGYFWYVISTFQ